MLGSGARAINLGDHLGTFDPNGPVFTVDPSPGLLGTYPVGRVLLGEDANAMALAMPQHFRWNSYPGFDANYAADQRMCPDGSLVGPQLPPKIKAAMFFPKHNSVPTASNPLQMAAGSFPVMLYAHAYRDPLQSACGGSHSSLRDFTAVGAIARHVASYGCIVVVPDISWIPGGFVPSSVDYYRTAIALRAFVLCDYFDHLRLLNAAAFGQRLNLNRLLLAGHSTGGPAAVEAGRLLRSRYAFQATAFGLIAPTPGVLYGARGNAVVLGGSVDTLMNANPEAAYAGAGVPKTFVSIPGANHFGYTDLYGPDNKAMGVYDPDGAIPRDAQQLAAAAYVTAAMRLYLRDDATVLPYLSGALPVPQVVSKGAPGIQVLSQGL